MLSPMQLMAFWCLIFTHLQLISSKVEQTLSQEPIVVPTMPVAKPTLLPATFDVNVGVPRRL